jgi:hypothetical protein
VPVVHSLQEYWTVYSIFLRISLSLALVYGWTFSKADYPRGSRPRVAESVRCISTTALWASGIYATSLSSHVCYGAPIDFNLTHRHLPASITFASSFESFLALAAIAHCEKKAPISQANKFAAVVNAFLSFALCIFSITAFGELRCGEVDYVISVVFFVLSTLCRGFVVDWTAGLIGLRDNPELRLQDLPRVGRRLVAGIKRAWGLRRRLRSPIAPERTEEDQLEVAWGVGGGPGGAGNGTDSDTPDEVGVGNLVDGVQVDEAPARDTADAASQTDSVHLADESSQTELVALVDESSQTDSVHLVDESSQTDLAMVDTSSQTDLVGVDRSTQTSDCIARSRSATWPGNS